MDRLSHYHAAIKQILQHHADLMTRRPTPHQNVVWAFDEKTEQYLLLKFGSPRGERGHYVKAHLRLHEGKIWIEQDWTEDGLAEELREAGVPHEDIILAFNENAPSYAELLAA